MKRRTHTGPLAIVAWVIALGWFALAVVIFLVFEDSWASLAAGLATLAGIVTGWIAFSLRVVTDAEGVRIPGQRPIAWDDIDSIEVKPGLLNVPQVVTRQGRGLIEHPVEGLAAGRRRSVRLAQRIADAGELGSVPALVRANRRGKARRAAS